MDLTESPAQKTTSFRSPCSANSGFTLIEILLVLGIIGLIMSIGLPAIQTVTTQRINSTTRRLTGMVKTVRNDAILLNLVHRLVINLDDQQYWIEQQKTPGLLSDPTIEQENDDVPQRSPFVYADKYNEKPVDVPAGVRFDAVMTEQFGLLKEGTVYIHFFPNGFVEQSILYLARASSDDIYYSLVIRPTAGKVDIEAGAAEGF